MTKYIIEWVDERTVWHEVEAKTKEGAIRKVLSGKGNEVDWSGSSDPHLRSQIQSVDVVE